MGNEKINNNSQAGAAGASGQPGKNRKTRTNSRASAMFVAFFVCIVVLAAGLAIIANINWIGGPIGITPGTGDGDGGVISDNENTGIKKFASTEELKKFLDEGMASSSFGMMSGAYGTVRRETMMKDATNQNFESPISSPEIPTWGEARPPESAPTGGTGDYSTTNVQVAGVDEADIVKTDGEYIYTITNNTVSIIKSYPAENSQIVSKIELDSAPQSMYLSGDKLAVYGQKWNFNNEKALGDVLMPIGRTSFTYLKVYDISDKNSPKEVRSLYFEGSSANSRMIGDYVYLVTSTYPYYGYRVTKGSEDMIAPIIIDQGEIQNNGAKDIVCKGCSNIYYFDIPYNSYTYTTVSSINIKDAAEKVKSEVFLLDQSQNNIYVSQDNFYITYTKQISEEALTADIMMGVVRDYIYPMLSQGDREMVTEIENTKNYILSPEEKLNKIGMILQKYEKDFAGREEELQQEIEKRVKQKYEDISKELERTVIHKIAIDKGDLNYKAVGDVTGMVLDQFSMDESAGYFRIATTKNRTWSQFGSDDTQSYSNIYVLDGDMKVVGQAEGIAKGEQIYAVRFMQNRAYMVTFKRTDPLFVIDLSDPSDPKILGELKVPGFSSYLHPYDATTLIGIGKESDENGRVTGGVKLSLFDVADVQNPKELDKYVIGNSSSNSIAIDEHKAFLFSLDKNLLVIPVSTQDNFKVLDQGISFEQQEMMIRPVPPDSPMPPQYPKFFNGAYVFSIDKFRFNLRGQIDHADSADGYWTGYRTGVQRSLYIKDILYTLSGKYLKANRIDNLQEVKTIALPATPNDYPVPMMK
ncbi:MAG: beta-propeller domain-containing protein [Candidatus Paceibacterota bacterium]|jgi:uncharacterized secreted protein with C-terminal beta-propeller domain